MALTWGKFAGVDLLDVPRNYLQWAIDNCPNLSTNERNKILSVLGQNEEPGVDSVLADWHKELCGKHKDCPDALVTVSDAYWRLKERLKAPPPANNETPHSRLLREVHNEILNGGGP